MWLAQGSFSCKPLLNLYCRGLSRRYWIFFWCARVLFPKKIFLEFLVSGSQFLSRLTSSQGLLKNMLAVNKVFPFSWKTLPVSFVCSEPFFQKGLQILCQFELILAKKKLEREIGATFSAGLTPASHHCLFWEESSQDIIPSGRTWYWCILADWCI